MTYWDNNSNNNKNNSNGFICKTVLTSESYAHFNGQIYQHQTVGFALQATESLRWKTRHCTFQLQSSL